MDKNGQNGQEWTKNQTALKNSYSVWYPKIELANKVYIS